MNPRPRTPNPTRVSVPVRGLDAPNTPNVTGKSRDGSAGHDRGRFTLGNAITLALLLAPIAFPIGRLASREIAAGIGGWIVVASLITYFLYASDKRRARSGEWRTPEKILHLWELAGGWPGAFVAQRVLRHKSSKITYLAVFWLIVVAHVYVAIDWPLGWRMTQRVKSQFAEITRNLK